MGKHIVTYPASAIQEQFWLIHQMHPDNSAYNIPCLFRLQGDLNIEVLQESLNILVRRHEILHSTFSSTGGELWQVVHESFELVVVVEEEGQPTCDAEQEIEVFIKVREAVKQPFDLKNGPLLRVKIFKCGIDSYFLLIIFHHIVTDLHSKNIFAHELSSLYNSRLNGQSPPLPPADFQYREYSKWQHKFFSSKEYDKSLSYWLESLNGENSYLNFPFDFQRPALQELHGGAVSFVFSAEFTQEIKRFSRDNRVTIFLVTLTIYLILLHRYSGQKKITIGIPFSNRRQKAYKDTLGCFVNVLPLTFDLSTPDNPFRTVLQHVRQVMLLGHRNQEVPYERLVQESRVGREPSYNPLFQTGFTFEPPMELDLHGLAVRSEKMHNQGAQLDLFANFWEQEGELRGLFEYNVDLFRDSTVQRLAGHFEVLLRSAMRSPDQNIDQLAILPQVELDLILRKWNQTSVSLPDAASVAYLFERQVLERPDDVACSFADTQLTYRELDEKANRLAAYLADQKVTGGLVGLYLERSMDMLIALLGVIKSGAAFIPLDPEFPKDRIDFMLADSKAATVITSSSLSGRFDGAVHQTISLDTDWWEIEQYPTHTRGLIASPDDLAYVIYTSGSTGKPKGVRVQHRSVCNFLLSMAEEPGFGKDDVLLAVTTLSFDISILELFLPLTAGGKIVIAPQESVANGQQLKELIARHHISVMQATPTTWRLLVACGWQGADSFKVLCGGEPMPWDLAQDLLERAGSVWNLYGPTETTVWSTCHPVSADDDAVLVGRPIANTKTYIVDKHLKPVPIGVTGELLIGGMGVTAGYHLRPNLTLEKFTSDHLSPCGKGTLYHTGDMASYCADGIIKVHGRYDQQIKLRGYRIELGEIEAALLACSGVLQCAVVVKEIMVGDQRLVAYYVSADTRVRVDLRAMLKEKLPRYMIPSIFMALEHFPLTANGKLDRASLPTPGQEGQGDYRDQGADSNHDGDKLKKWNETSRDYRTDCCLHTVFSEQAQRTPLAIALKYKDASFTYAELDQRTNQLGHYLQKQGVGPDSLVGVFMDRSFEMIIALYGILKAGGAYVPLDPGFPEDRLVYMADEAQLDIVLTEQSLRSRLPGRNWHILCLDTEWQRVEQEKKDVVVSRVKPNNLAYVIYTSGSTGRPKGVMNQHDGICNRLFWMQDEFQLGPKESILQKTPYSFDVSVWEFFWPLQVGACLVIAPPESHYDPNELIGLIERFSITTIHFVPSMLQAFVSAPGLSRCESLKRVICSGEALSVDLQEKVLSTLPGQLYNLYGPTEAAVDVTCWHCKQGGHQSMVPIGRPVANTQLYITDDDLNPVPIGVAGELLIGGIQVARGYLQRPDLTAESFIEDPFSGTVGAKIYRSGDVARFRTDGIVEYLGRQDYQVKMHGLRIELGEIEAVLRRHPLVEEAVVAMAESVSGSKELVAYIRGSGSLPKITDAVILKIRAFLKGKLPSYMVPSRMAGVASFPLTLSGKIDRKVLPLLFSDRLLGEDLQVTDSRVMAQQLLKIWQQILKHTDVSVSDNFFDVGGNSLLAVMLVSEINKTFHVEIPVVKFFQYPTIRSFAVFMDAEKNKNRDSRPQGVVLHKTGGRGALVTEVKGKKSRQKSLLRNRAQRQRDVLTARKKRGSNSK